MKQLILEERGLQLHTKKILQFFKVGFYRQVKSRLKSLGLRWFFIWRFFFYLTNVSVQVILFPLNLFLRASLTFFLAWKVKEALGRCWFCWFWLCISHWTYWFSDGCWLVWNFYRIFLIETFHPTDKFLLVLIICLAIIFIYYI